MTTSVADFLTTLRDSRLLEPARLEEIAKTPEAKEVDAPTLGLCLIQLGWLTEYQVGELLQGRTAGVLLGPYRLEDRLGNGTGQAAAYRARHPEKEGRLAVKVVPKERLGDPVAAQRLAQEIRAAAQLAHPSIARVSDVESLGNQQVYVREFVEGIDLAQLVREHGALPASYACDYIHQAAQALQQAHERGLTHGHIQPSNLIVDQSPTPIGAASPSGSAAGLPSPGSVLKIVDFGLGSLHDDGLTGSVAPADPARVRKDLNDLGRTFAFLLCGEAAALPGDEVSAPVKTVLQKLRNEEYRSAAELGTALAPLCGSAPSAATTAPFAASSSSAAPPLAEPEMPLARPAEVKWEEPAGDIPMASEVASAAAVQTAPQADPSPIEIQPPSRAVAAPTAPMAEAIQVTAPAAFGHGAVMEEPSAAPADEEPVALEKAPPRKRKYGPRFWLLAGLGLLLHVIAAAIFIIFIINMMTPSPTTLKVLPPIKSGTSKDKGKPKGMSKADFLGLPSLMVVRTG